MRVLCEGLFKTKHEAIDEARCAKSRAPGDSARTEPLG
jgi:hypothetical protein